MAFEAIVFVDGNDFNKGSALMAILTVGRAGQVIVRRVGERRVMTDRTIVSGDDVMQRTLVYGRGMGCNVASLAVAADAGFDGDVHLLAAAGVATKAVALVDVGYDIGASVTDDTFLDCRYFEVLGIGVSEVGTVTGFAVNRGAGVDPAIGNRRALYRVSAQMAFEAVVFVDGDDVVKGSAGMAVLAVGGTGKIIVR